MTEPFHALQLYANVPIVCCLACKAEMLTLLERHAPIGQITFACVGCSNEITEDRRLFDLSKSNRKLRLKRRKR